MDTIKLFNQEGYGIINKLYNEDEIAEINNCIETNEIANQNFRKNKDIFAIRQVLQEIPKLQKLIFNKKLKDLIKTIGNDGYFVVKSIYFDKPATSNWFVPYHQDLTISLVEKIETKNYINWTKKNKQVAVQPPLSILENIFTIRIHLDDTSSENGAVKVIPASHKLGIITISSFEIDKTNEFICEVEKGGIMLMKPLTLHSSTRTTNDKRRRVIHIEFSNQKLDNNLQWSEFLKI